MIEHGERVELMSDIRYALTEQMTMVCREAATAAAEAAVDRMLLRMGLADPEDLRAALRLARSWEAAKSRFSASIVTGIAGGLLFVLWLGYQAAILEQPRPQLPTPSPTVAPAPLHGQNA